MADGVTASCLTTNVGRESANVNSINQTQPAFVDDSASTDRIHPFPCALAPGLRSFSTPRPSSGCYDSSSALDLGTSGRSTSRFGLCGGRNDSAVVPIIRQ